MKSLILLLLPLVTPLEIISRFDWGSNPTNPVGVDLGPISDIVIGNDETSDCGSRESCSIWMRSLQSRDQSTGGPDLRFNFYVSSSGDVFEGTGWNTQGSFTEKYASTALGIAYLGDVSNGLSVGVETAIKEIIRLGYTNNNVRTNYCLMFTCEKALADGGVKPKCPGGGTYDKLTEWEPIPANGPYHFHRPCGCGSLAPPPSGIVNYANYDVGSVATYSCVRGYELIGDHQRECEISGSWSDLSVNAPHCVDPTRGLVIVPKKIWDVVVTDQREFIEGGFPIATFFVDVTEDSYCVDDNECRRKLVELKKAAWEELQEKDVLCNFYIAKTGVVYEGRGWGVKGAYTSHIRKTQGLCFLGLEAIESQVAVEALFKLIKEARDTKKVSYDRNSYCFQTNCPNGPDKKFCTSVINWKGRDDGPIYTNRYCSPISVPVDTRAPALECRHKKQHDTWLNYQGTKSVAVSGCPCLGWADQGQAQHHFYPEVYPYADLHVSYCRNPDMSDSGPWCITDPSCGNDQGIDSCGIPQCAESISFDRFSAVRYTLDSPRSTDTDKLTMTIKSDSLNATLLRIEGGKLNKDPALSNYWDVSLVEGHVQVVMALIHGDQPARITLTSSQKLQPGVSSEIQILRKNHRVLMRINGEETKYVYPANFTSNPQGIKFFNPKTYIMGRYLTSNVFTGCMADVVFNRDNLFGVITGSSLEWGELIVEGVEEDDGCLATLPFSWSGIDFFTTPPPPTVKPTDPIDPTEGAVVSKSNNLPYIIIGVVILLILIILLIGCFLFKRHNKDKGVYKVDEAITTKWDWKKGILPVLTETRKKAPGAGTYDQIPMNNVDESPEVFA